MELNKLVELLEDIRLQIKNNFIQGYKNLLYIYYNIIQTNDTTLLQIYNDFIEDIFDKNIILNEEKELRLELLSSKVWSQDKFEYKQKLIDEWIIPTTLQYKGKDKC